MVMGNKQNRGIIDGAWSPNGNKFAYSTGTYKLFIGFFDTTSNWWYSEAVNKHSINKKSI